MKTLLLVIFIAAFCGNAVMVQITKTWTRYAFLDGFLASPGNVTPARSIMHCGSFCSRLSACQSFFFVAGEQASECQLHKSVYLNSSAMVQTPNVTYYIPANYSFSTFECQPNDEQYHNVQLSDNTTFTYKFHQRYERYADAVSICANETGTLVKVTTNAKLDMLRKLLFCPEFPTNTVYYINGACDDTNSTWSYSDGTLATFPDPYWAIFQPKKANKCSGLAASAAWLATSVKCIQSATFICEK